MDIKDIIKRVRKSCDYESDAALARALGMSPQNFLSQKKSGGIKDSLVLHAIEKGINPDWVKTGRGEIKKAEVAQNDPVLSMLATLLKKCEKIEDDMANLKKRLEAVEKPPSTAEQEKKQKAG